MTTIALIVAIWFAASFLIALVVGRLLRGATLEARPVDAPTRFEPRRVQVSSRA